MLVALARSWRPGAGAGRRCPDASADLFNPDVVQRIDLRVHTLDWEKLKQNFQENTYYPADFVWNGQTVYNAGHPLARPRIAQRHQARACASTSIATRSTDIPRV